ncbi:MAG: hypothetical protein V1913_13160 [Fibrobacterota bacterium]
MTPAVYKGDIRKGRIELKEFLVLFLCVAILTFFAVERIGSAKKRAAREEARKTVASIIVLQKRFSQEHGRYGNLSEIGFANPFHDNSVEYKLNLENEFVITAKESPCIDSYGDNLPGNEYFIGYPNGAIEYNKK